MDRTHALSAQTFTRASNPRPSASEIDAFYESHGHEVFARAYRLRRRFGALAERLRTKGTATTGFAARLTKG